MARNPPVHRVVSRRGGEAWLTVGRCIFCRATTAGFNTREHILPESLGGGEWAVLAPGLFCDGCQSRFGSHIEQQALADYPFTLLRIMLGVPTKKSRAPWTNTWQGRIAAGSQRGQLIYEPAPPFEASTLTGEKTSMRLLAHSLKPSFVGRFLLKMAIETVAQTSAEQVFTAKYDAARIYALTGQKSDRWWFVQKEDLTALSRHLAGESIAFGDPAVALEVIDLEEGHEVFHLHLAYLDMFVPITAGITPEGFREPEFQVIWL